LAPAIEMTGGEGFAKVMPAAFGFFLGALFILGLIKYSPSSYQF
jgi:ZIP family zinc transporter